MMNGLSSAMVPGSSDVNEIMGFCSSVAKKPKKSKNSKYNIGQKLE